jgi:Phage integrase family
LKKAFKKAGEKFGIKGLRWNDLRHTFGTRLDMAGANAFEIKELMGHTDVRTSLRYVHSVSDRKRAAVDSVINAAKREQRGQACPKSAPEALTASRAAGCKCLIFKVEQRRVELLASALRTRRSAN